MRCLGSAEYPHLLPLQGLYDYKKQELQKVKDLVRTRDGEVTALQQQLSDMEAQRSQLETAHADTLQQLQGDQHPHGAN